MELLDEAREAALWKYFCEVQHDPYVGGFDSISGAGIRPMCAFCGGLVMVQYMWGGSDGRRSAHLCHGCGYRCRTEDGGLTWQDVTEKED